MAQMFVNFIKNSPFQDYKVTDLGKIARESKIEHYKLKKLDLVIALTNMENVNNTNIGTYSMNTPMSIFSLLLLYGYTCYKFRHYDTVLYVWIQISYSASAINVAGGWRDLYLNLSVKMVEFGCFYPHCVHDVK